MQKRQKRIPPKREPSGQFLSCLVAVAMPFGEAHGWSIICWLVSPRGKETCMFHSRLLECYLLKKLLGEIRGFIPI